MHAWDRLWCGERIAEAGTGEMAVKSANAATARLAAAIYLSVWGVIPPKSGSLVDFTEKPRKNSKFSSAPARRLAACARP